MTDTPTTPTDTDLREQTARNLAAGEKGPGAHWSDLPKSMQDMYRRAADHALMAVGPELHRLRRHIDLLIDDLDRAETRARVATDTAHRQHPAGQAGEGRAEHDRHDAAPSAGLPLRDAAARLVRHLVDTVDDLDLDEWAAENLPPEDDLMELLILARAATITVTWPEPTAGGHPSDTLPPREPRPGDRVRGYAGRHSGVIEGTVVYDPDITVLHRLVAVRADGRATPYAVSPPTVEVIEPAAAGGPSSPCVEDCTYGVCGAPTPCGGCCACFGGCVVEDEQQAAEDTPEAQPGAARPTDTEEAGHA